MSGSGWKNAKDESPTKKGKLVVLIGDEMFLGEAGYYGYSPSSADSSDYIVYELCALKEVTPLFEVKCIVGENKWIKPAHYKEVTHWMAIPEKPTEENKDE